MRFVIALVLFAAIASAEVTPVPFISRDDTGFLINTCLAASSSTTQKSPTWTTKFVYPIEVCGMFYGRMNPCTPPAGAVGESKIVLSMLKGKDTIASLESTFVLVKQNEDATTLHCSTFQPCDILSKLSAANSALNPSEIELVGTVSVTGVEKIAGTGQDPKLQALMRAVGIAVSSKVTTTSTHKSALGANYAVVREGTFCEEGYKCITTIEGTAEGTAEMTTTTQKMMLLKDASLPTCEYKENAEGTKLHMTVFTKKEGVCAFSGSAATECKKQVTILDQDEDTGSASSLAVTSTLTLMTLLALTA